MLAVLDKKKLLEYIQRNGPILPSQLVGQFNTNTIMIGATFSEMVKEKSLAVSHAKVGSSPVYYVAGQEEKLAMLYKYLNEKDQRTYDLLKEKKVLRENDQTPLIRVSLTNLKDFAHPLQVTAKGKDEIFWKWYVLSQDEAIPYIKELLEDQKVPEQKKEELQPEVTGQTARKVSLQETKQVQQVEEQNSEQQGKNIKQEIHKEEKKEIKEQIETKQEQRHLQKLVEQDYGDPFMKKIYTFCQEKRIMVAATKMIKKNTEYELFMSIPSIIGEIQYYAKARVKKKITEGDLATLYLEAERKKLPALLITAGVLTKKAQDQLIKEFVNMKVISL